MKYNLQTQLCKSKVERVKTKYSRKTKHKKKDYQHD